MYSRVPPPPSGLGRLLAAVEELPLRYAPFFDRLSDLWDLPEELVRERLLSAKQPGAFSRTGIPGVRRLRISGGPRRADAALELLRLAPGTRFPTHRHLGEELVLVLEGSYCDAGRRYGPGAEQRMAPGSAHALEVTRPEPCVATVVSGGIEFENRPLRLLHRWVR